MVPNKNTSLFVIGISLVTILWNYRFYDVSQYSVMQRSIATLDRSIFNEYMMLYDENRSYNIQWGIEPPTKKKKPVVVKKDTALKVTQKKNLLCIEKECFRFLGIYADQTQQKASFFNHSLKNKIKLFTKDEVLYKTLYVQNISHLGVTVADANSSRIWQFKLFDVNQTKYKPKDINESLN